MWTALGDDPHHLRLMQPLSSEDLPLNSGPDMRFELMFLLLVSYLLLLIIVYIRCIRIVSDFPPLTPYFGSTENFPLVSIIMPVRNQEDTIEQCLVSLINSRYANKEIIVIDGNSEDNTFAILNKYKDRVTVLKEPSLKNGWVGKNLACDFGQQFAGGSVLLFTDGDTIHDPYCLSSAVNCMIHENADMLSLWPEMTMVTFWERAVLPYIFKTFFLAFQGNKVNDQKSEKCAAFGPFILVKKRAYDSIGGHAAVRNSTLEDYRLGQLLKSAKKKTLALSSNGMISTRMYSSLREIWGGWVKNSFEGLGFRVDALIYEILRSLFFGVLPFALLVLTLTAPASGMHALAPVYASLFSTLLVIFGEAFIYGTMGHRWWYAIFVPCVTLVYIGIQLHSAYLCLTKKGVRWKGRIYKRIKEC